MSFVNQWGYNLSGIPSGIPSNSCSPITNPTVLVNGNVVTLSVLPTHEYMGIEFEYNTVAGESVLPWTKVFVQGAVTQLVLAPNTAYLWRARLVCDILAERKSAIENGPLFTTGAAAVVKLGVNRNTVVINALSKKAVLVWAPVPGVSHYEIRYRLKTSFNLAYVKIVGTAEAVATIEGLQSATQYEVFVDAVYGNEVVSFDEPITFATLNVQLNSTLSNLRVLAESDSAMAIWDPVFGAESFNIILDDAVFRSQYVGTVLRIPNLTPNTQYMLTVIPNAQNGIGEPVMVTFTTKEASIPAPTDLVLQVVGNNIEATWTPAILEVGATQVLYINGQSVNLSAEDDTYSFPFQPSTRYNIGVVSKMGTSFSSFLTGIITSPFFLQVPSFLETVMATPTSFSVSCRAVIGATAYRWQLLNMSDVVLQTIVTESAQVTFESLTANTEYKVRVRSELDAEVSAYSVPLITSSLSLTSVEHIIAHTFTDALQTSVIMNLVFASGRTKGTFAVQLTASGQPTVNVVGLDTRILITGLLPAVLYNVSVTYSEENKTPFVYTTTYQSPADIGLVTGFAVSVSSNRLHYTTSGSGQVGAVYLFKYRRLGSNDNYISLGIRNTMANEFTLTPGHYEFTVNMIKNNVTSDTYTANTGYFLPAAFRVNGFNNTLLIQYNRTLSTAGFTALIDTPSGHRLEVSMPQSGQAVINNLALGIYRVALRSDGNATQSMPEIVSLTNTVDFAVSSDIYDCIGCCGSDDENGTTLKTYAVTIMGPQTFTIPRNVNSFSISNMGNSLGVKQDIAVTGIIGLAAIPANIKKYEVTVTGDSEILSGEVTVAPAINHTVFITYLM